MISSGLTVIICTYNRAFILEDCLNSLACQNVSLNLFHVLVINNNSTDDTRKVAERYAGNLPGFRVVDEPRQGLACARNRGLIEAQTEWVAFLDDDAKARPDWVAAILDAIGEDDFDGFGGPYYAWHRFGPAPNWFDPAWGTYAPEQTYGPLTEAHIPGGNCALRREYAIVAGNFPEDLGMSGKKCAYGEETLLFERMRKRGFRLGFVPKMIIDHCVLPYKYSFWWKLKSGFASGSAWALVSIEKPSSKMVCQAWARIFLKHALLFFPMIIWRAAKSGQPWRRVLFETLSPIFNSSGYAFSLSTMYIEKLLNKTIR
jgi:glycosyltransferase involved in cell wall biosynthesis